jgi:N-acetylmuramoyl-L-alanine amidase
MVLVTAFMPSVLVEIGFGTNPAEAAYISGDSGQRAIAGAVADAAMEYLAHYERRVSGVESTQEQPE